VAKTRNTDGVVSDTESCSCHRMFGAKWRASPTESIGLALKSPCDLGPDFGPII